MNSHNYGGSSDPGDSTASDLGLGPGGSGVLPGVEFGYFGPSYNVGYYGARRSGFGENTPYSPNNWYRPGLGEHHRGPDHPFHRGSGNQPRSSTEPLDDTLSVDDGSHFAAGSDGEGNDYYGPSYNWAPDQDEANYASFGPNRGYGPGNWFNPETSPDYGGPRPPHAVGSTLEGYGQPFSAWSAYQGTQRINAGSTSADAGTSSSRQHYRGVGPRNYRRSDERIREDVNEALTDDQYLNAADIDARVSDGVVTLVGTVSDRQQKRRARDVADSVRGVHDVNNLLHLHNPDQVVGAGAETVRGQ